MSKHNKTPRLVKTQAQLVRDLKKNQDFVQRMKFTKEEFFPALIKASKNVDDAKMWLASINTVLMEKFLGEMKKKTFKELDLVNSLDDNDETQGWKDVLSLFDNMSVFEAKDLIEGMRGEIDLFISQEMKSRTLDTLQVKWIDEV